MVFSKTFCCSLFHGLDTIFRAKARSCLGDFGSEFWDLSVGVWSHSYLTCGEILDLYYPNGHEVTLWSNSLCFGGLPTLVLAWRFEGSAVVCLAFAPCLLSICRLCFGTVNALWQFAFYFVPEPKQL